MRSRMLRWPWLVSAAVHTAAVAGAATLGLAERAQPQIVPPVVISIDVRPEPPVLFRTRRAVFSWPVQAEPEVEPPRILDDLPEPRREEEIKEPARPLRPDPAEPLDLEAPPTPLPDLQRVRRKPQKPAETPSPEPLAVSTKPEPLPPEPVAGNQPPPYPDAAKRRGVEGSVLVRLEVSREGTVVRAEVAESSGSALLDEAALSALRRWRFRAPGGGRLASSFAVMVPVRFALREPD